MKDQASMSNRYGVPVHVLRGKPRRAAALKHAQDTRHRVMSRREPVFSTAIELPHHLRW